MTNAKYSVTITRKLINPIMIIGVDTNNKELLFIHRNQNVYVYL